LHASTFLYKFCFVFLSDSEIFFANGTKRIGGVYKKAIFRAYTDDDFDLPYQHSEELGLLGPVIAGEIGDTIKVVFKNKANNRVSVS